MTSRTPLPIACLLVGLAACACESVNDGGEGADADASADAGTDAGTDTDADADSDSDSDADSDSDTELSPDAGCDEATFDIAGVNVDVLIVLDRSNSMCNAGLWAQMTDALVSLTSAMELQVNFGLSVFPSLSCEELTAQCSAVSEPLIPVGEGTAAEIAAQIAGADDIGCCGGTPTTVALEGASDYLGTVEDGLSKFVLLATDGAPACNAALDGDTCTCITTPSNCGTSNLNCLDDVEATAAAGALAEAGIPVYVLGVGDSLDWQTVMDGIAAEGGTDNYYPADDETALAAALQEIVGAMITCEFDIDWSSIDESADPNQVNFFDDTANVIPYDEGCLVGTGWDWLDDDTVVFCEDACDQLRSGTWTEITAVFGCDTVIVD